MTDTSKFPPLSLAYYTVPELTPPEVVEVAAAAGCQHAGLRLLGGQPGSNESLLMTDLSVRRDTISRFRDLGLTPLDANTARLVPQTVIADYETFLSVAAQMGARHVLATGNDPEAQRLADNMDALCALAATYSLSVEVEFVPWLSIADVRQAVDFVEKIDRPNLGIALDALHFQRSFGSLDDVDAAPARLFRYMHLCDAPGRWDNTTEALIHAAVEERLCPGDGGIDLVGLLQHMPRNIPIALEVPMATLAKSMGPKARAIKVADAARNVLAQAYDL